MDSKFAYISRWIGYIPCAMLAYILTTAILKYPQMPAFGVEISIFKFMQHLLAEGCGGYAFITVGAVICPKKNIHVLYSLVCTMVALLAISITLQAIHPNMEPYTLKDVIFIIAGLVGLVGGFINRIDEV